MAEYDKFDSKISGPRGFLAADWLPGNVRRVVGIGYDNAGRIVVGKGVTGIKGVLILTKVIKAGRRPVDPMKRGEIVGFDRYGPADTVFPATPGTNYVVDNITGMVEALAANTAPGVGKTYIGHTVEKGRLIVECAGSIA